MPRYHFNVHDGKDIPDKEGMELPNVVAARRAAVRTAGALLQDHAELFWDGHEWSMDVSDDRGLILFKLIFIAIDSAASSRVLGDGR